MPPLGQWGGSVAEWLVRWTHNLVVQGSSSALHGYLLDLLSVVPSSNSRQRFCKNSQLVAFFQLGIFMFRLDYFF